ncbi:MAG: aspartate-semialdehyde dehydrogenase [Flavobacteriales bacterium]|jgi:aspartate-semialdehyde dehydrogenase
MIVAIVGATGMVGQMMLRVLAERNFPITDLVPVASEKSVGKQIEFKGKQWTIVSMADAIAKNVDLAIFSAGGETALKYAGQFAETGAFVIDNSSAFRMDADKKLIVPEINGHQLTKDDKIIPNPNCSTIQLVMTLKPLHELYTLKRVIVSTYQSISGTGMKAVNQLENERNGISGDMAYPYPIDKNCLPHCDIFEDNGYTKEEMKLVNESRKILDLPNLAVAATAVRVPVEGGHSEAVNVEFEKMPDVNVIRKTLHETPGITLQDNPDTNTYPMPLYAKDKDEVFVGRIRKDVSLPQAINMWIVSDNLRKGAATNSVQIAEYLLEKGLLS